MEFTNIYYFDSKFLSWELSSLSLFRIQKRLSKSYLVGDFRKCLFFQKLVLQSNYSRLLAIREITQISTLKRIPGVDGKTFLTFTERFELNEFLRMKTNSWNPSSVRNVSVLMKDGNMQILKLFTISDRVWQLLIKYSIEPIYEVSFHPHVFGFRISRNVFDLQKFLCLNFSYSSNVSKKRVFLINLQSIFLKFDKDLFLERLIAPRGIKLGLFRSFNSGFTLGFFDQFNLSSFLANVVLNDLSFIHASVRFGYEILFILKPFDDEKYLFNKVVSYLKLNKLSYDIDCLGIFSPLVGFNFLDWNFIFCFKKGFILTPTFWNYQQFLLRVKRVLNNSNYGSVIKASKLSVLVKEWRIYNKFCSLTNPRLSLFYLKKRAFKIFNKESRQDSYSSKKLLEKSFPKVFDFDRHFLDIQKEKSPYFGHLVFDYDLLFRHSLTLSSKLFCIHCGLKGLFF